MFIYLTGGLREIREIGLTPLKGNNEIKNLANIIVCLQLKEE